MTQSTVPFLPFVKPEIDEETIQGVADGLYLDRVAATQTLSLSSQPYNPTTGAYDGPDYVTVD